MSIPHLQANTTATFNDEINCINSIIDSINSAIVGTNNAAVSITYTYSTTTTNANPGNGVLRLNNSTLASVNAIYVSNLDVGSIDWTNVLASFDDSTSAVKGTFRLSKSTDYTKWVIYNITSYTAHTGYAELRVSFVTLSGLTPFAASDGLVVNFSRTGDKGIDAAPPAAGANSTVPAAQGIQGQTGAAGSTTASGQSYVDNEAIAASNVQAAIDSILKGRTAAYVAIAGSATTDLGSVASNHVLITGTASITSFGSAVNQLKYVKFASASTVNNSNALILPRGSNKTAVAGDIAVFQSDASGNWSCINWSSNGAVYDAINLGVTGTLSVSNGASIAGLTQTNGLIVSGGDITAYRAGGTSGVIFLDSGGGHYLYWDGTNYNLPSGSLIVGGTVSAASFSTGGSIGANGNVSGGGTGTFGALTINGSASVAGTVSAGAFSTGGSLTASGSISVGGVGAFGNYLSTNGNLLYMAATQVYLQWNGSNFFFSQGLEVNGQLLAHGNVTAFFSDKRLKENFEPIDNSLDRIDQIDAMYYTQNKFAEQFGYKDYSRQVGLIAQQVKEIFPEVVAIAPFDDDGEGNSKSGEEYLTIRYQNLVPILVQTIKDLRKEKDEQLSAMQKQIDDIKKLLN